MPGKVKWLWSINSGSNVDTSNLVTINTEQTITGVKTFNGIINATNHIKNPNGDLVLDCSDTNHSINMSSKKVTNVATPTNNTDAANKQYADGCKNGNGWTTINTMNNVGTLTDVFVDITNYANCANNFRVEDEGTYEVMFKCNIDSKDIYASCILATNSANYDNVGYSSIMYWGAQATSSIQYGIYLKNNQFKVSARRPFGTNTNWSTNTRIYVRKIAQGNIR